MIKKTTKKSYTIPCSSLFRDCVLELADRKLSNVADIARSVMLTIPSKNLSGIKDPGEPDAKDRETVILKSGPSKGRPWRRKPRLQVRMSPGHSIADIRRALYLAIDLDKGETSVDVINPEHRAETSKKAKQATQSMKQVEKQVDTLKKDISRLKELVETLSFEPIYGGVEHREDALYILGFPPESLPDEQRVKRRFRTLAGIYHPDGMYGDHIRMIQLNSAFEVLRDEDM